MEFLTIDGAQGEGGGQVLRTSLTLAALYGIDIEIINIRAGRPKPGLLRQHLTAARAVQQITNAQMDGLELGSLRLRFNPGPIQAGDYHFAIGSAGSTTLVCQTVLPLLMGAQAPSRVTFEGGTHNGMSPSLTFLQSSFLPLLAAFGLEYKLETERLGFYPAGGGCWHLEIQPAALHPLSVNKPASDIGHMQALVSRLDRSIAEREVAEARIRTGWNDALAEVRMVRTPGPGNAFMLLIPHGSHKSVFETTGKVGLSAEKVARRSVGCVKRFLNFGAQVEEHLADQLLIPLLLAGKGEFTTTTPTQHFETNRAVIEQITGVAICCERVGEKVYRVWV